MKTRFLLPLLALAASTVHAALMYSGVQNVAVPFDLPAGAEGVYVRLSDGTVSNSFPVNWDTEPWLNPFFGGVDVGNSALLRPVITGTDQIVNLAPGTVIGLGSNFAAGESGSTTHTGPAANQFQIGTPGIMGFVFNTTTGGPDYYGWLRMTVNNTPGQTGTIVDWAIDDTAGEAVLAGVSAVPEPAAVLVGLALCGVSVLRRRRGSQVS